MKKITLALLALTSLLNAQSYQGGIRGRVIDPGGGALAVAKVTLIDEATSVQRATISNETGEFVFNSVDPATYTISVESPGFKKFDRKGVILATQASITLDLKLEIGDVTESVNVTEEVPLMETSNASTGQVVDRQKLVDLPNLGRNPFMMAKIAANVVQSGDPRFNRMQDQSGSSAISIAGGPVRGNNYLLDGVPITDSTNRAVIIPTIESVQEVKVQANTYDAEMGRTGGGMFNTYLKSGSNEVHGSLFGYTRQSDWLANNFFNNRSGVARPDQPFYNYGASLGGPVIIPKVYNGRNKTFVWFGAKAYRQKSGLSRDSAVPTLAERNGDFSKSLTKAGALQTIYDPTSTRTENGAIVRDPFPGNIIPANRINPIGKAIASYFPSPQRTAASLGANNFLGNGVLGDRADQVTGKLDHEVTSWWRANVSYLHYKSKEPGGNLFSSISAPGASLLFRKVDATQVNSVFTPSPTMVVSVRYGFNRFPNQTLYESSGFNPTTLGFPSNFVNQLQTLQFPQITMQTMTNMGAGGVSQSVYHSKNALASVSKFMGRHSLKAGFDYRLLHIDSVSFGAAGAFTFNDQFTRKNPNVGSDGTGSDVASLLLGFPSTGSASQATNFYQFIKYYAGYVQDDFRVSSKLTVNMGIRYEYETGPQDANNHFLVGFDPKAVSPLGAPAIGGVMFAGVNGNKSTCCNPSTKKFAPRVGVAYAVNDKTTIRGGYGIFWAPISFSGLNTIGYSQTTDYIGSFDGNLTPAGSLTNPFPTGLLQPSGNSLGLLAGVGSNVTYPNQNSGSTRVQQFSFDIQRQIGSVTIAAAYVGSRTADLIIGTGTVNYNQLNPNNFSLGSALLTSVDNPFFGKGGIGVIAPAKVQRQQLLRPFPQFGAVNATLGDDNHAKYDSFVLKAQKRMSMGMTFVSSWTYSKNMDNSFGTGNFFLSSSTSPQNAYDLNGEYGLAIVNTPSSFKNGVTYELPFGKGKTFLGSSGRLLDGLAGGWQINAVTLFQTGFPLTIIQDQNLNSGIGAGVQRPNATGVSPATSGSLSTRIDSYINPAAFSTAPQFTFGNLSRTIGLRSPGTVNWDLSVIKSFAIYERFKGQFRAEAINAMNTPLFNGPNSNFGNANFGKITQQGNFPRYIQLGVRMTF